MTAQDVAASESDILSSLTPAQVEAVTCVEGPLLMLAGPGSGKTRVVTHRIAYMLRQGISARRILALTFTNKAADEMRLRLQRLAPQQPVWIGTFHRFCARLLRQYGAHVGLAENYSIYDADDAKKTLKQVLDDERIDLVSTTPDAIAAAISWAKNNLITAEQYTPRPGSATGSLVGRIYPVYQQRLLENNAVDFDDLLLHVATLLRESPELRADLDERWQYILVDEYQDTNLAQYAVLRALSVDYPNLAVTGDPDQSIYGWRGANLSNILEFEHDFPEVRVVRLEQNYRSSPNILRVADSLIVNNVRRKKKSLFTENDEGRPVRLTVYPTQRDEAEDIAARIADDIRRERRKARDFAIFYRTNALSRSLEKALDEQGVPYQIVNGLAFYQRKEIKDLIAYLHLLNNPRHDVAFRRIVNTPARGIGKSTLTKLTEHALRYRLTMLEAARECGLIEALNKRAAVAVARFVAMYDRLCAAATEPLEALLGHVLSESGYRDVLVASDLEEDQERLANIEELLTDAREFDAKHPEGAALEQFLEQTALVNDTDDWEVAHNSVTLMTMHGAKGLEFPVVYIIAVEEGLIPHDRSRDDPEKIEEERRLLFVGITRAEEELQLSLAQKRSYRGRHWPTVPSNFLMELPREEMELTEPPPSAAAYFEPAPEEVVWSPAAEPFVERSAAKRGAKTSPAAITTAAAMLQSPAQKGPQVSPDEFHQSMIVTHPEYGSGVIVALSGEGVKRTATVRFFGAAGQRKFRLVHSHLQPVKSRDA